MSQDIQGGAAAPGAARTPEPVAAQESVAARWHRQVGVALVDDNAVIRMGLRALIEASDTLRFVGEAGDGEAAVELVRATMPDVVLLDVRMPRRDGVAVAREVAQWTRVLMLTYSDAPEVVSAALDAGASGYLVHGQFESRDLEPAILAVAQGSILLSPPAARALREARSRPAEAQAPVRPENTLSERQREVMEAIAQGKTNTEIARELYLSEKTVKNHINRIFASLQVRNRAEAVSRWLSGA